MNKHDLLSFAENFPDEKSCRKYLEYKLWNGDPKCPYCKNDGTERKIYRYSNGRTFKCSKCSRQFQVTTGTIYQDSNIPLRKWFLAYYLFSSCKNGISSVELGRHLNISQKAAWYLMQKLRTMINKKSRFTKQLEKTVEVDETYIGGKKRGFQYKGRSTKHKTPVFGILQRNGELFITPVPDTKRSTLQPLILSMVKKGSKIMSDEWWAYTKLNRYYNHRTVKHKAREYVRGTVHTNSIEGVWSVIKRALRGTYIRPSRKYLDRYCAEFQFRYNTRLISDYARFEKVIDKSRITLPQKLITS